MIEQAIWNTRYMADNYNRPLKIKNMTITQTNNSLKDCKTRLRVIQSNMDGLYERRFVLMQKEDKTYTRKNTKLKIVQTMGLKQQALPHLVPSPDLETNRLKQILILALDYLQEGKSHSLIEAILKQARDDE